MTGLIVDKIPDELLNNTPQSDVIAPCFAELDELAKIDGIEKRVAVVYDDNEILSACSVCYVEKRRHHGAHLKVYSLFGYLLHDYSRIYCTSREAMNVLKKVVIKDAKQLGCDIIIWSNIPYELVPKDSLQLHEEIKIFDAQKSEQGWSRFYKSKHVKYSLNRAKKINDDYHVDIIDGYVPDNLMDDFERMHISRWRFAGSDSPFLSNPYRKDEYRANPSNKHFLRIFSGDELLACHYGMKYGRSLLFHTPIINPKFLDLSPMKLILAETARYCEANNIVLIDFGHGDEAYKDGYCTLPRYTCNYEKAISLKGQMALFLGKLQQHLTLSKFKLLHPQKRNKFITLIENQQIPDDAIVISSWVDFCDFCSKYEMPIYKWQYESFKNNKSIAFVAIIKNGKCLNSYWTNDKGSN
ncbi:MAG: GNAT family N-acetyltransferase [Muribaculum sp.]|nr:GNAT family N-acetyltransferase [Muribaculum sp.]